MGERQFCGSCLAVTAARPRATCQQLAGWPVRERKEGGVGLELTASLPPQRKRKEVPLSPYDRFEK